MSEHPKTRDSDQVLTAHYWHVHERRFLVKDLDGNWCMPLKNLKHATTQESIKRVRALIQNERGELLPQSKVVRKARRISEDEWRDFCTSIKYGGVQ